MPKSTLTRGIMSPLIKEGTYITYYGYLVLILILDMLYSVDSVHMYILSFNYVTEQ